MAVDQAAPPDLKPEERWPAVDLAYEFVRPSYEITMKRLDAIEGRIRAHLTLAASVTFAVPVLAKATDRVVRLDSPWLLTALATFVIVVALGVAAGSWGSIRLPDLRQLYEKTLHLSAWEFKRRALYWAADTDEVNTRRLTWKGRIADAMALFIIIEVALLAAWAVELR